MINLKIDDGKDTLVDPSSEYRASQYPYGLCLYLDDETCERLGITEAIAAGTEINLTARALVVSCNEAVDRDNDGEFDISLNVQITDLELSTGEKVSNAARELYWS